MSTPTTQPQPSSTLHAELMSHYPCRWQSIYLPHTVIEPPGCVSLLRWLVISGRSWDEDFTLSIHTSKPRYDPTLSLLRNFFQLQLMELLGLKLIGVVELRIMWGVYSQWALSYPRYFSSLLMPWGLDLHNKACDHSCCHVKPPRLK